MAYEIPRDLIKQLQISLRNEAKISSYDPHHPSLPNLPSFNQTIAELDPSPPYLRCKHCKGRLLRDLKSFICVFCGREQYSDVPPNPINFKNTIACRWLLQSLDLDGSEMVGPIDLKESNRGKSPEQFPLTDLLDLEIRWPESDKNGITDETPAPSKSTLNLAGVDLGYYFTEEKNDTTSKASDVLPPASKQTVEDNADLSLFDKFPSSESATRTTKHESDDSFSGWEASFQTASSATSLDNSKSIDPFVVSGVNVSSSEMTFGDQNKSRSGETEDTKDPSSSTTNDWFQQQDDLWSSSNHKTVHMPDQVEQTGILIDGRATETTNYSSSATVDWFQDDQWQGGSQKKPDDKSVFKDDDSADTWDNFTSSTGVQGPSDNSRKDIVKDVPKVDEISEVDFFSTTTTKDSDFRDSSQPISFAEAFPNPNGTSVEKAIWPDASDLTRMGEENGKSRENSDAAPHQAASGGSSTDDAQMIMEKMHDLSFMLESNLSIPPK
ncbi:dentin sialophosphoprotein [Cucumis melo var. makuwa]|uniref:Dentin sialophosphoprotein n=1 Tax=Cucumis melo var. makuwa TaxID=1194695 RepID=A0A5D3CEG4_CUCMM|nr:dentin sialophosphoprotein [Cucumis melo var. makuwa]